VSAVRVTKPCDSALRADFCDNGDLKALATQLAIFEQQSLSHVDPRRRDALRMGRSQFEQNRTKCANAACSRDVMLRRTREIADIVSRDGPRSPR
jgi:hypothetical protein